MKLTMGKISGFIMKFSKKHSMKILQLFYQIPTAFFFFFSSLFWYKDMANLVLQYVFKLID